MPRTNKAPDDKGQKGQDDLDTAAMQEQVEKAVGEAMAPIQEEVVLYKALAEMSDVQKTFYESLSEEDQTVFLAKSTKDRDKEIKKVAKSDEVLTLDSGVSIKKSDVGEGIFSAFKSQEDRISKSEGENEKLLSKLENTAFAKAAEEEYPSLPGLPEDKGALLKAIDVLPEEQQEICKSAFTAAEYAFAKGFDEKGSKEEPEPVNITTRKLRKESSGDKGATMTLIKAQNAAASKK